MTFGPLDVLAVVLHLGGPATAADTVWKRLRYEEDQTFALSAAGFYERVEREYALLA